MKSRAWIEASAVLPRLYHYGYSAGWLRSWAAPVPVVSVGGLTMGGSGKTPFSELVAGRLSRLGLRVAIVSRGYRREGRKTLVVSRGDGPIVDVRRAGDEPWLLARRTTAIVVVGADRIGAARVAADQGADVVIVDDGFQHRRLRRDLDLVLVDGDPKAFPLVMPFGLAREPLSALARADVVVAVHEHAVDFGAGVHAVVVPEPWRTVDNRPKPTPPDRAFLVSAIARPVRFERLVARLGVPVCGHLRFRDHRWLSARDVARARRAANRVGAAIVTTEKDAVRWPEGEAEDIWVLPIRLAIRSGEALLDAALKRVVA